MLTRARISLKRRHEVQVKKGGGGGEGLGELAVCLRIVNGLLLLVFLSKNNH